MNVANICDFVLLFGQLVGDTELPPSQSAVSYSGLESSWHVLAGLYSLEIRKNILTTVDVWQSSGGSPQPTSAIRLPESVVLGDLYPCPLWSIVVLTQ